MIFQYKGVRPSNIVLRRSKNQFEHYERDSAKKEIVTSWFSRDERDKDNKQSDKQLPRVSTKIELSDIQQLPSTNESCKPILCKYWKENWKLL